MDLNGKKIAILATNGFEQSELETPRDRLKRAGATVDVVSLAGGLPIPTKPPVYNGMIAPRDSWMMPPPCNEMIPPGAPRLLA